VYTQAMAINGEAAALGMPPVLDTTEMRDFEDLGPAASFTPPQSPDPATPFEEVP
jgi:hypothetical protein